MRYFLLVANLGFVVFFLYLFASKGPPTGSEQNSVYLLIVLLILNGIYLGLAGGATTWLSLYFERKKLEEQVRINELKGRNE